MFQILKFNLDGRSFPVLGDAAEEFPAAFHAAVVTEGGQPEESVLGLTHTRTGLAYAVDPELTLLALPVLHGHLSWVSGQGETRFCPPGKVSGHFFYLRIPDNRPFTDLMVSCDLRGESLAETIRRRLGLHWDQYTVRSGKTDCVDPLRTPTTPFSAYLLLVNK